MQSYNYLPHTADVKFEAFGITLRDLFRNAGLATCNAMYDPKKVFGKDHVTVELQAESAEQLLHRFLEEILFLIDTKQMLFNDFRLLIDERKNKMTAEFVGEPIDAEKHTIKALVKAITWHQFELQKLKQGWRCVAIVDV